MTTAPHHNAGTSVAGASPELKRVVSLPLLILYGLGVTIGAGIYVLIGATTAKAGVFAPSAFLLAALVMAFSAASFAEFVGRTPVSAGEAAYVASGFRRNWLTLTTGGLVVFAATVAAAAIGIGCAGYVAEIIPLPINLIAAIVIILMGMMAAWGVQESVTFAGILTLIEIGALLFIIGAGIYANPSMFENVMEVIPSPTDQTGLAAVLSASLVAFFAFIGFDSIVNLAEEADNPSRTMPLAIFAALSLVTLIYFLIVYVALQSVSLEELSTSRAPVGLLFERLTGVSPLSITLIAIVATANGIVIQIIMAARVVYGLTSRKRINLPWLGRVNPRTQTPLNATFCICAFIIALVWFAPLEFLAELTSQIILIVFTLVNGALVMVKLRKEPAPEGIFVAPLIVPIIGAISCIFLLIGPVLV